MKSLHTISVALGVERTRNELLPYILDLMDDDEEILVEMAQTLDGSFLQYVGGPLFAPHLFKPLERLCEVEEPAVREKVSAGIQNNQDFQRIQFSNYCSDSGSGKHKEHLSASECEGLAPANYPDD